MIKKNRKNLVKEDRALWLNFTPKASMAKTGKKKFFVNKNQNSEAYSRHLNEIKTNRPSETSLKTSMSPKHSNKYRNKSEIGIQVINEKVLKLEQELNQKGHQISVLSNMYDLATRKIEEMTLKANLKTRTSSIADHFILSPENFSDSKPLRTSSLPSLKPVHQLPQVHHPTLSQPHYTKSRPKLILTNPITGIIPFNSLKATN
jgi:hypothetical protein